MIHIIHGSDTFRIQDRVHQLCAEHPGAQWIDLTETTSMTDFIHACNQHNLFNPYCFIRYKNPIFLTTKVTEKTTELLDCLTYAKTSGAHTIILYTTNPIDKRFKLSKQCLDLGRAETFTEFKDWDEDKVIQWINARIRYYELTAEPTIATTIWHIHRTDLQHIDQLIQTIRTYLGTATQITQQTLTDLHAFPTQSMLDAHEALKSNQPRQLLQAVTQLLNDTYDPVYIISSLANQCRLYIQLISDPTLSHDTLAKQLGKHPYFIQKQRVALYRAHTLASLTQQYKRLIHADFILKSGSHDTHMALLSAVQPLPTKTRMQ